MPDRAPQLAGAELQLTGAQLLEAISSGLLLLYGDHYGQAPKRAKTYLNDNVPVCVLQDDLLTRAEVDDVRRGADELVLNSRVANASIRLSSSRWSRS